MVRLTAIAALAGIFMVLAAGEASAETYRVSDLATLAGLLGEKAQAGDIIEIEPGTYYLDTPRIAVMRSGTAEAPIVVRGVVKDGKRPVIDASKVNVMRGIFYIEEQAHDIVIENLELCNAVGGGREGREFPRNAAGVYFIGDNLTLRNSYVHHCENGLFSTHESDYVLVEDCEIGFNGREKGIGDPHRTHGFYFNSAHQMVKGCYIHDSTDSQNFKSRGGNTIFAFNRVEEECAYSLGVDSNNEMNTLWLGNVVVKRTYDGINQGRLLGVGDGTGVAGGVLVAANNTFVTVFERDFYLFTFESSTTDVVLVNNAFAGPGKVFLEKNGQGKVTGRNNWIQAGVTDVPADFEGTIRGTSVGFADAAAGDRRPGAGSALADAGVSAEEYRAAIEVVLANAASGSETAASGEYLRALADVKAAAPAYEPVREGHGFKKREGRGRLDIGAYEFVGSGAQETPGEGG